MYSSSKPLKSVAVEVVQLAVYPDGATECCWVYLSRYSVICIPRFASIVLVI